MLLSSDPDQILLLLKTRGPQTAAAAGAALGITGEAARQRLVRLSAEGLVAATATPVGVGRPAQVYDLTTAGHARFPDGHAELAVQLLGAIRRELGEESLDRLITARGAEATARYVSALRVGGTLGERVGLLARLRSAEGYMAECREVDGGYLLIENHCPICAAATACLGFCRSELASFRLALGDAASVERLEHLLGGDRRCVYRIRPADDLAPTPGT